MNITLNLRDTAIGAALMLVMVANVGIGYAITKSISNSRMQDEIAAIDFTGCSNDTKQAVWIKSLQGQYKGEVYLRCLK